MRRYENLAFLTHSVQETHHTCFQSGVKVYFWLFDQQNSRSLERRIQDQTKALTNSRSIHFREVIIYIKLSTTFSRLLLSTKRVKFYTQ